MAEYTDIAEINILYEQSRQVAVAINNLDAGGGPMNVTIGPPPSDYSAPMGPGSMVTIQTPGPHSPAMITELRTKLVAIESDLAAQLAALGVTSTPPARTGGGR